MDKKLVGKYLMMALGYTLTLASAFVGAKNQDAQIKDAVAEEVQKALSNQTK